MDNKEYVDKIFDKVSSIFRDTSSLMRSKEKVPADKGTGVSLKVLLERIIKDYRDKLGVSVSLDYKDSVSFSDFIDTPEALPFMAQSLVTAGYFDKYILMISKISGVDMAHTHDDILMPVFIVCAGTAMKIHTLKDIPELDIQQFDEERFHGNFAHVSEIAKNIREEVEDHRQQWISFLAFDFCAILAISLSNIFSNNNEDVLAEVLFSAIIMPAMSEISSVFSKGMAMISAELDNLV